VILFFPSFLRFVQNLWTTSIWLIWMPCSSNFVRDIINSYYGQIKYNESAEAQCSLTLTFRRNHDVSNEYNRKCNPLWYLSIFYGFRSFQELNLPWIQNIRDPFNPLFEYPARRIRKYIGVFADWSTSVGISQLYSISFGYLSMDSDNRNLQI